MDNKHGLVEDAAPHSGIRSYVVNPTNRHRSKSTISCVEQTDADRSSSRPRSKGRFRARKTSGFLDSSGNMARQGRESTESMYKWRPQASPSWFMLSNSQTLSALYDDSIDAPANETDVEMGRAVAHLHSASLDELSASLDGMTINDVPNTSSSTDKSRPRIPRMNPSLRPLLKANKQFHLNVPKEVEQHVEQCESNFTLSANTSSYFNARQHGIRVKPNASKDRSTSLVTAPAEADLLGSGVWKITDSLYIGTELFSMNYHSICRLDIKHTIELQAANEETNPPYQRCFCEKNHSTSRLILKPIPNEQGFSGQRKKNDETLIIERLGSFCKAVNEVVSKGEKVLVFSKKAVNRGPAFCSAYLMLLKKITKQAAQFEVKKRMFPHTIKIEPYLEHTLRLWNVKLGYLDEPLSLSTSTKELSSALSSSSPDLREEGTTSKTRRLKRSLSRTASRIFRSPSITTKK